MSAKLLSVLIFVLAATAIARSADTTIVFFPEESGAVFSVEVPKDWQATPFEVETGSVFLEGPSGVRMQLIAYDTQNDETFEDAAEVLFNEFGIYLEDSYREIQWNGPSELAGAYPGLAWTGSGFDRETGLPRTFVYTLVKNGPGGILEVNFHHDSKDTRGAGEANAALKSFKVFD